MLETFDIFHKLPPSATYIKLLKEFEATSLETCNGVHDFGMRLSGINCQITALDKELSIPEVMLIQVFLRRLGPAYSTFVTAFNLNNVMIPVEATATTLEIRPPSFTTALWAAVDAEYFLKDASRKALRSASCLKDKSKKVRRRARCPKDRSRRVRRRAGSKQDHQAQCKTKVLCPGSRLPFSGVVFAPL